MAFPVDLGNDTLYVADIVYGDTTPGNLSGTSLTTMLGTDTSSLATLTTATTTNLAAQRFTITGVNMNAATTDHAITLTLPAGATTYVVDSVSLWGASHTLTTATAGLFTAASGGGTGICADQAITNTSGTANTNLNYQALTLAANDATTCFTASPLYFRVGTAEGAAATANVTLTITILG